MSNVTVEINGKETVSQAALQASGGIKKMSDDSQGFLKNVQVTAGDVVNAVSKIASTVGEFFTEYAEQQKAVMTFNAAISQSGQMTDGAADRLRSYAGAMAIKTGADDEAILSMTSFLATSGRTEDQIRKVIAAAADMSTVTGKDLKTSVEQINKTFSGSARELGTFVEGMKDLTAEELKSGAGVDLVAKNYAGLADKMGGSASVTLGNLKNTIDDTKAALGEALMPAVQPVLEAFVAFLNDPLIPLIKSFAPIVKEVFANVSKFITEMKPAVEPILKWFGEVWTLVIGPNIKSLGSILKETLNVISAIFNGDWKKAWDSAKKIVTDVIDIISRAFKPVTDAVNAVIGGIEKALQSLGILQKGVPSGPISPGGQVGVSTGKYAEGTSGAAKGWALVGEEGPEVVYFHGGETVIPNHKIGGYAAGTITGGEDAGGGGSGSILGQLASAIMPVVDGLLKMVTPLASVQAILNPLQTIFSAMMDVLGPLINTVLQPIVGILRIVGMTLGAILAPVISALGPVIKLVSDAFIWLYNNAIRPVANGFIWVGNQIYNAIVWVINKIRSIFGGEQLAYKSGDAGSLAAIKESDLVAAGGPAGGAAGASYGAGATYQKPRDITINVSVETAALVGEGGITEFAMILKREFQSLGVLNMGTT